MSAYGVGIIGTGVISDSHAVALSLLKDRARLIAAADLNEQRLRDLTMKHFVPHTFSDHRALLARDDIDIVIIATPPNTHEPLVTDALAAGKHVICEKPLAHTLASADRIIAAAKKSDRQVSVVYQVRYGRDARRMIWLRDQGYLGDLIYGNVRRMAYIAAGAVKSGWWGRWNVAGGGVVMTQFIHELDLMLHLYGDAVEVKASMDTLKQDIESEDTFVATVRFGSGAVVTCSATVNAHQLEMPMDVVGTKASVHLPWSIRSADRSHQNAVRAQVETAFPSPKAPRKTTVDKVKRKVGQKLGFKAKVVPRPPESSHTPYFAAFLDALDRGEAVPIGVDEGRRSLELCVAIYTSALTGATVSMPLDADATYYDGVSAEVYAQVRSQKPPVAV